MLIAGLEKLTLIDYPGKLSAIIFTYGCNMMCPYCHNPELVTAKLNRSSLHSEEDVMRFLKVRVGKLDALTITGGEPMMQKGLINFIRKVKDLGYLVKLDTNGSFPLLVREILELGVVDYWALDVKYSNELYMQGLNGGMMVSGILETIELLKNGAADYEFRTTFMKGLHTEENVHEIGEMIQGSKRYFIQNFRPGKTIDPSLNLSNSFTEAELEGFAEIMRGYVGEVVVR